MEATSLSSSIGSSVHRLSSFPAGPRPGLVRRPCLRKKASSTVVLAYGSDYGGGLVDESMIVLRRRIHETRIAERNYEPPSDWMSWEKQMYTSYPSDVCEVMGLLQTFLMNTRPSLGIGMMALVMLSVPASAVMILYRLIDASTSVLSGMHLN